MKFKYTSRDAQGAMQEGVQEAPDRFTVARELRSRGEFPISVDELAFGGGTRSSEIIAKYFSKVSLREKILFTHNLSGMLSAGLSLYRALEVLRKQNRNPAMEKVLAGLLAAINQGGTLSEGLAKYPKVFSMLFVSMVRAGEESGNLSGILKEIGSNLQKSYELSRKIKGALMYPAVIVFAILIIGILMLMFVVPTLTKIFRDLGTELPPTTKLVIFFSDTVTNHPLIFFAIVIVSVIGLTTALRAKKLIPFNHKVILKLPVIGGIVKQVNAARTARTLASLLIAGVEMTKAITITRDVLQNMYYKEVLDKALAAVQKGEALSTIFKNEEKLYPVMVGEMMAVGEETGALTNMLTDIAVFYEEEVDEKTKSLSTIIEPILMVFIGAAVGFFAISMISPMYSLLNNI